MLKRAFPADYADRVARLMASGLATDDEHDRLSDTVSSDARLYSRFRAGERDDPYHIDVRGLGGLYYVWANEYGATGYFTSIDGAESYIQDNWNDTLLSYCPRNFRPEWTAARTQRR